MVVGHLEITQLIIDCSFSMRNPVVHYIDCATPTTPSPAQMASDPQPTASARLWVRKLSPTNMTFDCDVFVWGILSLCQVHNALPNSLNTGDAGRANQRPQYRDAGQIKDLNIGDAGRANQRPHIRLVLLAPSVPLFLSVPRSWHICWWINLTMVLDLFFFLNPLRWDVGNMRH